MSEQLPPEEVDADAHDRAFKPDQSKLPSLTRFVYLLKLIQFASSIVLKIGRSLTYAVNSIAISPDGQTFVSADKTLLVWGIE